MPEGHTLRRLSLDLDAAFAGTRPVITSPQGRFAESAAIIDGEAYAGAASHGKNLFVGFGDAGEHVLYIHLGLIGSLRFDDPLTAPARLRIAHPAGAPIAELRGPQTCRLITPAERDDIEAALGPDPLRGGDGARAWDRIARSGKSIAALLMDQRVVSGVGNVYRAEVLFRNRIRPDTPGNRLRRASWDALWSDLVGLMPLGVRDNRIDTVRVEHAGAVVAPGGHSCGGGVYVYRRAEQPCLVCGSRVRTKILEGRNLFWCGRCQRRG